MTTPVWEQLAELPAGSIETLSTEGFRISFADAGLDEAYTRLFVQRPGSREMFEIEVVEGKINLIFYRRRI